MNVARLACPQPPVSADSAISLERQGLTSRGKISRNQSIAETGSSSEANGLRRCERNPACVRSDRSRKGLSRRRVGRSSKSEGRSLAAKAGWSSERRARQASLIRTWAPWQRSAGPKTEAGKARCSMNALRHGYRSRAKIREYQKIRYVLRLAARNIAMLRAHIQARKEAARPQLKFKPWYVRMLASAKADLSGVVQRTKLDCRLRLASAIAPA
jgi:hypothetical protein